MLLEIGEIDILESDLVAVTKIDDDIVAMLLGMIKNVSWLLDAVGALGDLQNVLLDVEVGYDILAGVVLGKDKSVFTRAAAQLIITATTIQLVVARAAKKLVVTNATVQLVVAFTTVQLVVAAFTKQLIITTKAPELVAKVRAVMGVVASVTFPRCHTLPLC